jgi:hypothetical protein
VTNLITLCMAPDKECHLRVGHGGGFHFFVRPEKLASFVHLTKGRGEFLETVWKEALAARVAL